MRLLAPLALATSGALALSACGSADGTAAADAGEVTVKHAQGETKVPSDPKRIAVLDYGVLDSVEALGGTVVATPKKGLPKSLDAYAGDDVTDLGTLKEIDVEALAEADPDLILIGGRSADRYKELSEIAPTVDLTLADGDFVPALKTQVTNLGTALGAEDKAAEMLADVESKIGEVKGKTTNSNKALVLLVSGGKVSAYGSSTRAGSLIHDTFGVPMAVDSIKGDHHGQAVSFEFISEAAPEQLFVIDRDAAIGDEGKSAKEVLDNELVGSTPAWRNDKVTYLDATAWYLVGSGLQTTPVMADEIAATL